MDVKRRGPLTWAQHIFWYYNDPAFFRAWGNEPVLRRRLHLPPGTTAERLTQVLDECADRFEALRTVYAPRPDGVPEQIVLAAHRPPLIERGSEDPRFDVSERPSLRCLVDMDGDALAGAEIVANQIDLDGYGIEALRTMIERRLSEGADFAELVGDDPLQPLDLAEAEAEPRMLRFSHRGVAAQSVIRDRTPRNALPVAGPGERRARQRTVLCDPDLLERVEYLGRACGASPASIFHAMAVAVIAAWSGEDRIALTTATANRWRPGARGLIGRLASEADYVFDVDGAETAAAWFKRVHGVLLPGYRHAVRDYGACTMQAIRENARAGSSLGKTLFVEYLQFPPEVLNRPTTPLVRTVFTETEPGRFDQIRFDISPMPPGVEIVLTTDTAILPAAEAQRMVNLIANLLRRCADRADLPIGAMTAAIEPSPSRPIEWITGGGMRFDAERIRRHLRAAAGVIDAAVRLGADGGIEAVVRCEEVDAVALHEHMLREAGVDPLACVPTAYLLLPPDPACEDGATRFVPTEDYCPASGDDPRIAAVAEAFAALHPGAAVDPARSYAELGGRYLLIRALVARLERAGWSGAVPDDFLAPASLAAVARRLVSTDDRP